MAAENRHSGRDMKMESRTGSHMDSRQKHNLSLKPQYRRVINSVGEESITHQVIFNHSGSRLQRKPELKEPEFNAISLYREGNSIVECSRERIVPSEHWFLPNHGSCIQVKLQRGEKILKELFCRQWTSDS
ncbi:unnamed protein product [Sphenostylis stenocarpa]|uniref:Uncharacterized protein n=1 Tax=Sphenostylis stenocarpa TaxID=92480 RepID=A0AA86VYP6_9FABA|nr:unnamed protein product [Sphenostylis stenocarpa]